MSGAPPSAREETRAAYHAPTGRLILSGPGWSGIGTLEDWEDRIRVIRREIERERMKQYTAQAAPFLDTIDV